MKIALTRSVSPRINECQLSYLSRQSIDVALAIEQHGGYLSALSDLGLSVVPLPPQPDLPDSVFVEDTAVVLDEVAVLTTMGLAARKAEVESMLQPLSQYREVERVPEGTKLEGGDVMRVGRELIVGISTRSDLSGIEALERVVRQYGYEVRTVRTLGCLHLKTGCTFLGDDTILVNKEWVDTDSVRDLRPIEVHPEEPWAANTLRIGETVLVTAGYPRTRERLEQAGFKPREVDVSELTKAEAGLTCMSLVLDHSEPTNRS